MIHDPIFLGVMLFGLLIASIQNYMAWSWILGVRRRTRVRALEQAEATRPTGEPNQPVADSPDTATQPR